ncbi:uncharacterized protein LOC129600939 [Paramacrobiotus metropolitanus]|uniref:uncharacterized protein LOC129600939 n=1 Tax=Paramacrobiotus metropolitanus TaxID=2943436 RepID=UPI0024456104|nr:uncharacterized protein LOC129600939 [Paramacrobiotus metropolitanus]
MPDALSYNERLKQAETSADGEPKRKTPSSVVESGNYLSLPLEVLKEVFLSLDTIDRDRCRRTCHLWDALLTAADVCSEVRTGRPHESPWDGHFLYACIAKHITPATRTISLRENGTSAETVFFYTAYLLERTGIRLHRFISHGRATSLREHELKPSALDVMAATMTAGPLQPWLVWCCERVIVKDFLLSVVKDRSTVLQCRVPLAVFTGQQVGKVEVVELLEKHLRSQRPPLDVQRIAQCLANVIVSEEKAILVKKILEAYQAGDPRPSAHYREQRWCLYNMASVDVSKLNRFCLCALWNCMKDWCNGDKVSSDSAK